MLRHRFTFVLLAFALFLRVLVPAGWMPASSGGVFAIEPCPAASGAPLLHAEGHHLHHGSADHHSHGSSHDGDCAFAPLSTGVASLDLAPLLATRGVVAQPRPAPLATPLLKTGPPALPPPATGPPALA
jgi:hypothetical protein